MPNITSQRLPSRGSCDSACIVCSRRETLFAPSPRGANLGNSSEICNAMDISRKELGRIISYKNPYVWAINDTGDTQHRYFFLDKLVSKKEGDTPLMRLLALHSTPTTVENFLLFDQRLHKEHHVDPVDSEDASKDRRITEIGPGLKSNHCGVSPLHVALHRNSWYVSDIVRLLLKVDPTLVRRRMETSGSYPLHISMANSLTVQRQVLQDLLAADPSIVREEDVEGDNPVSLLYKNVLRFRWARNWVTRSISPDTMDLVSQSWMTVVTPDQFLDFCLTMIRASQAHESAQTITWHTICAFPRCPPLLIKILAEEWSLGGLLQRDSNGLTPLHWATKATAMTSASIPRHVYKETPSTLELIMELAPKTACIKDELGLFPLHYALANPTIEGRVIEELVEISPVEALMTPGLGGLVPFQLAAARSEMDDVSIGSLIFKVLRSEPSATRVA